MRKLTIGGLIAVMTLGLALGSATLSPVPLKVAEANAGTQWNASYYNNTSLSGDVALQRVDDQINFDWGEGKPADSVNADNFSVRWTKTVNFTSSGSWTFKVGADDGIRMWIDVTPIVDEWHGNAEGYKEYTVTLEGLTAGNHELKVEYYEATGGAKATVSWSYKGAAAQEYGPATWNAEYWNDTTVAGPVTLTRTDNDINFNWGDQSPDNSINDDNFSARWTTKVNFPYAGQWQFKVGADDGVRMWIDVTQILNEWHGNPEGFKTYTVDVYALTAGEHELKVEYYEATGNAGIQVRWYFMGDPGGGGGTAPAEGQTAPAPVLPATVYAGVTGDYVNVRIGPGLGNPVMTQIFYPDDYLVLGGVHDLSWLLIDLGDGTQGWVSNEWVWLYALEEEKNEDTTGGGQPDFVDDIPRIDVAIAPPGDLPPVPPRVILMGQSTDTLNLRNGPSLYAAEVIGSIPQGVTFTVEAHNGNGAWYLIEYQGVRGWVSALYVRLLDGTVRDLVVSIEVVPMPPPGAVVVPQAEPGTLNTVRGVMTYNVKLRNAASLQGAEIDEIPSGTTLLIEGRNTTGAWYLVTYNGQQGWIYSPNVTLIEGTVPDLPIR